MAEAALDLHCQIAKMIVDAAVDQGIVIPADFSDEHRDEMNILLNLCQDEFDRAFVEALIREDEAIFFLLAGEAARRIDPHLETITSPILLLLEKQLRALRSILFPQDAV